MRIGIDMGHTLSGKGTGSVGCGYKEQDLTRELGKKVIALLKQEGHTVIDCTCNSATTNEAQLKARVDVANKNNLDLFVSIHFNACVNDTKGDGKTTGTEVLIYNSSSKAKPYAERIVKNLASLGLKNRGVKTSSVYVLKYTNCPSLLIETCFIDDRDDMNIYLKSVDKASKAIVEGILNKVITTSTKTSDTSLYAVCVGAYNINNANKVKDELIKKGYTSTYLIKRT